MRIIGIAWTLACYFVVPVLAFEDLTPIDALKRSSKLFRDTWGEKVIGGFIPHMGFLVPLPSPLRVPALPPVLAGVYGTEGGLSFLGVFFLLVFGFLSSGRGD